MAQEERKNLGENLNHIREGTEFCEYLGDSFYVKYSKLGISSFKCPMYSKTDDIACMELRTPNCPFRDRLLKIIEKL